MLSGIPSQDLRGVGRRFRFFFEGGNAISGVCGFTFGACVCMCECYYAYVEGGVYSCRWNIPEMRWEYYLDKRVLRDEQVYTVTWHSCTLWEIFWGVLFELSTYCIMVPHDCRLFPVAVESRRLDPLPFVYFQLARYQKR